MISKKPLLQTDIIITQSSLYQADKLTNNFKKSIKVAALAAIIATSLFAVKSALAQTNQTRPNILMIVTDNQAPSTLGCYGNQEIKTPNIDRLANQGIIFQNAFSTNGMCSPTRASILTGLIPSQHGVHTWLDDHRMDQWPKGWCAIDEFRSLPQTLAEDGGYDTALIGKYHLGEPYKMHLKFNYWVTFPRGHTKQWYDNTIIDNDKTYIVHEHITDFWTKKAIKYINSRQNKKKPFFLYLAYNGPYGLPPSISGTPKNRFAKLYSNKTMQSMPISTPNKLFLNFIINSQKSTAKKPDSAYGKWGQNIALQLAETLNNQQSMQNYASQITLVDDGIGKVLEALKENGLDKNTLVILLSDQGLAYGQKGFWGQSDQSFPSNLYDTEMRIPLIFRKRGHIAPLQSTTLMVSEYDLFPTILDYVGLNNIKIANTPGKSFAPLLKGKVLNWKDHDAIYMEQEETRAIQTKKWKFIKRYPMKFEELYDMVNDSMENNNLAKDPKYAEIKAKLNKRLDDFFAKYSNPEYNLWKGGTVKSNSDVPFLWKKLNPNWKPVTKLVKHPFTDE